MPRGTKGEKRSADAILMAIMQLKMKFKEDRPFVTPEAAERKLLELANAIETDHTGRLSVAVINRQFRDAGGSYEEYGLVVKAAIAHGWITMHPSGGYLSFTKAGADLFA
jgi:hypothetical protein